jgi:hypothetical protein
MHKWNGSKNILTNTSLEVDGQGRTKPVSPYKQYNEKL